MEVARSPQPYQIPLYFPPFPTTLPKTNFDNSYKVANALRKYQDINTAELTRLRGDLTAYRQEAQTAFRRNVAFPRATNIPVTAPPNAPTREAIRSGDIPTPPSPSIPRPPPPPSIPPPIQKPDDSDTTMGAFGGVPTSGGEQTGKRTFAEMYLETEINPLIIPTGIATQRERQQRRDTKTMREIRQELRAKGIRGYSKLNQQELLAFASANDIDISRGIIAL